MLRPPLSQRAAGRAHQRGLSLVELMVGITVGMFVVAAAATLIATQLFDNRRLLLDVQVQQDLRAAADIIARDLRRAGAWGGGVAAAQSAVWSDGSPALPAGSITDVSVPNPSEVDYRSGRSADVTGPYGFMLDGVVLKSRLAASGWQALTDETTMEVRSFNIAQSNEPPVRAACTKVCADGTQSCWPTITVRSFTIDITGRSKSDPTVQRSVHEVVRLRNDQVAFNDPADPSLACPP